MPRKPRTNSSAQDSRLEEYFSESNVNERLRRRLDACRFSTALFKAYRKDVSLLCRLIRENHVNAGNCGELADFIERALGQKGPGSPGKIPHEIHMLENSIIRLTRTIEDDWRRRLKTKRLPNGLREKILARAILIHTRTDQDGFPILREPDGFHLPDFDYDIESISIVRIRDELRRGPKARKA